MTTIDEEDGPVPPEHYDRLKENLAKVEGLSARLLEVMARKKPHNASLNAPNHSLFTSAATAPPLATEPGSEES